MTMNILSLLGSNWGEELAILLVLTIITGIVCALLGYFRDWLVSIFKIQDALDKLDEVKRKLEEMDRKLNDIKKQ